MTQVDFIIMTCGKHIKIEKSAYCCDYALCNYILIILLIIQTFCAMFIVLKDGNFVLALKNQANYIKDEYR